MKEILEKIKKMQVGTKVAVVVLAGVLVAGTTTGVVVHNNNVEKKQQQIIQMQGQDGKDGKSGADGTSSVTQNFSEEEVLIIDEIVEEAIRDYSMDFSKNIAWSDVLSKEDRESLVKIIAGSVSEDLSKKKTAEVKDLLIEMFADEEYLSMTGTTNLSQEVKTDISRAVIEALSSDSTEDRNETYNLLQETLEKVITERIKEASIEYSLSETDITNIKEIIIENLGNVEGEDGYTPVKGEDYFTTEEITSITQTITNNVENYVNNQELATAVGDQLIQDGSITVVNTATPVKGKDYFTTEEINAMSTTIKNNLMYIVAASQAQLESSMEDGNDEVSAMIGTSETTNNTNIYSSENTYKSGDVIVKDGKIYICNTEIMMLEYNYGHEMLNSI